MRTMIVSSGILGLVGCEEPPPLRQYETAVHCGDHPAQTLADRVQALDRDDDGVLTAADLAPGEAVALVSMSGAYVDNDSQKAPDGVIAYSDRHATLARDADRTELEMSLACYPTAIATLAFAGLGDERALVGFHFEAPDRDVATRDDDVDVQGAVALDPDVRSGHLVDGEASGMLYGDLPWTSRLREETGVRVHIEDFAFRGLEAP